MREIDHAVVAMRRLGARLAVAAVVLGLVTAVGVAGFIAVSALMGVAARQSSCTPSVAGVPIEAAGDAGISSEQFANAAAIVATGRELGVPDRGLWVALGTALQESGLRNLDYGDRDSLGLFQQRPSQGWGSAAEVRDPRYAATQFFTRLVLVPVGRRCPGRRGVRRPAPRTGDPFRRLLRQQAGEPDQRSPTGQGVRSVSR